MRLLGRGSPMKLVKAHGNAELAKRPRKPKESKWAKDIQEKNKRDTRAHK